MPTDPIYNSIAGGDLRITELTDPKLIEFYTSSVANQINDFRASFSPAKRVRDLAAWIADVIIETTAQGASLLEVHVIDPAWTLLMRDSNGVSFIDVDDEGFLWPPVEVNFPKDVSDATWRLCQARPSTSLTEANLILTFEDKIVSELREHYGAQASLPNQTRAEFIQSLVKQANFSPVFPGDVDIRFVHLLPKSTFTVADLTMQQRFPSSATKGNRKNPNKLPASIGKLPANILKPPANAIEASVDGVIISIEEGISAFTLASNKAFIPVLPPPEVFSASGIGRRT